MHNKSSKHIDSTIYGTKPAKRIWTSNELGTEVYVSDKDEIVVWTISDFDVVIPVANL